MVPPAPLFLLVIRPPLFICHFPKPPAHEFSFWNKAGNGIETRVGGVKAHCTHIYTYAYKERHRSSEFLTMEFTQEQLQDLITEVVRQTAQGINLNQNNGAARQRGVRNIPCPDFTANDDFELWLPVFRDAVRVVYQTPAGNGNVLDGQCLEWIPTKLAQDVRSVYEHFTQEVKQNWEQLVDALRENFSDENEKMEFLSTMDSFQRTPGMSLREYKNELKRRMHRYQRPLLDVPGEFQRVAVQRFREGLRDSGMAARIMMSCRGNRETLENAFDEASAWERTMQHCGGNQPAMRKSHAAPMLGTIEDTQPEIAQWGDIPRVQYDQRQADSGEMRKVREQGAVGQNAAPTVKTTYTNPKTFNDMIEKIREHELGMAKLKTGQTELKDSVNTLRSDVQGLTKSFTQLMGTQERRETQCIVNSRLTINQALSGVCTWPHDQRFTGK